MLVSGTSSIPMTSTSATALPAAIASTAMTTLSGAISAVGIDSSAAMAFIGSASSTGMALKDGAMGLANAYKSVSSFAQWMRGGEPVSSQSLASLAHGLNALHCLTRQAASCLGWAVTRIWLVR